MAAVLFGSAQPPNPAAARNKVGRRAANGVQRRLGRRIGRLFAAIGAVLARRLVRVGPERLVQPRPKSAIKPL
jgi:hypothetical protein